MAKKVSKQVEEEEVEDLVVDRSTPLISIKTGEYPLYLKDLGTRETNTSFGVSIYASALLTFGYAPVMRVEVPTGDVVEEQPPVLIDGVYWQVFTSRPFTAEEVFIRLSSEKEFQFANMENDRFIQFQDGFPHQFADGVYHVSVSDSNRLTISENLAFAKGVVAAGGTRDFFVRVQENKTITLTAAEMVAFGESAFAQVENAYSIYYGLVDMVVAAQHVDEFPKGNTKLFNLQP